MLKQSDKAALCAAALSLALLVPAAPAMADRVAGRDRKWSGEARQGQGRSGRGRDFMRSLDLSPAQRDQIRHIRERRQRTFQELRNQMRDARQDLQRASDDRRDHRRVEGDIDRIASLQARLTRERLEQMIEVRDVLTPAQREQMRAAREKMRGRFEQRRNHGEARDHDGGVK